MKKLRLFYLLVMIFFIGSSCEEDQMFNDTDQQLDQLKSANLVTPKIKIAVVSDIHYMHPSLLPTAIEDSPSLMEYLGLDRKLLEVSDPIFRKVVLELMKEKPDILLVPGDLTKDGELMNHEVVKGLLQDLENTGIKVYVVPGNNDIDNPDAFSYVTEPPVPVTNITVNDFADIYGNFGYNEALYTDLNSLSYICKPFENLWILGIDNIKYTSTAEGIKISGAINPATLGWIEEKMEEARENNIRVIALMHYGILEHYSGQKNIEPLISNSQDNAIALLSAGINLIFTGHFHANDIVNFSYDDKALYDIQTGSLVTPPCSYRVMDLDDQFIKIETKRVTDIEVELPGGLSFLEYCDINLTNRSNSFFTYYLHKMFGLPMEYASYLAPFATNAYKAYFAGDEKISPSERELLDDIPDNFSSLVDILRSVWTDLDPCDNKLHIKLK